MTEDELLARIYEAPDDDAPREVYADWLSERGDPRGELILLQLHRARGETDADKSERERELLATHGHAWLPDSGEGWRERDWTFGWQRGFVDAVYCEAHADDIRARVRRLATSQLRMVRRLELELDAARIAGVIDALALPALSMLRLSATGPAPVDVSALSARAPRLAILALYRVTSITGLAHDALRELRLRGSARLVAPRLPAVDTVELDVTDRGPPPVLDPAAFPALRCVVVPNARWVQPNGGLHWLAALPFVRRLERVTLGSLTDADWARARALAPSLAHLRELRVDDVAGHERDFDALRAHIPGLTSPSTSSGRTARASRP